MRYKLAFSMMSVAILVLILGPSSSFAQKGKNKGFGGQGAGGFGGGGGAFGGGGFGGAGFGGLNGAGGFGGGLSPKNGGMATATDPNAIFDSLAQGRGYFLASESGRLAMALSQYLATKGNNTGQVTRDAFVSFYAEMGGATGGRGFPKNTGMQGGFQGANPLNNMSTLAASEFAFYDRNGDGVLNLDEMPPQMRAELSRWDTNHDNLISLEEYVFYYGNRMLNRKGQQFNPVNIMTIEEEDLDTRPVVYRGNKLPTSGLPNWFRDLADKNAQVPLLNWYKDGREIDEFKEWDRNDDGFITVEEAMSRQRSMILASGEGDDENGGYPPRSPKGEKSTKGKGKGKGGPKGIAGADTGGGFGGFGGGDPSDFGGGKKGKGKGKGSTKGGGFGAQFQRPE